MLVYTRHLHLCKGFNLGRKLEVPGYLHLYEFLNGGKFGKPLENVSWEKEHENLTYKNLTSLLFPKLQYQGETMLENWKIKKDIVRTVFTSRTGFCSKININATNVPVSKLFFLELRLNSLEADKLKVMIVDTDRSTYYMLNTESTTGDAIEPKKKLNKIYYSINYEEIHWEEDSGECTNYGDEA